MKRIKSLRDFYWQTQLGEKRIKRLSFTLLEIMLVLVILSLAASVVGWQISKCVHRYAFHQEIENLYNAIKHAQGLSLTYETDIDVHFFYEKESYYYQLLTHEPFIEAVFNRQKNQLKEVSRLFHKGKPVKTLLLSLFSQGVIEPRSSLGFIPKEGGEEAALWFDFQGGFSLFLSHQKPSVHTERKLGFPEEQLKKQDPFAI